MGLADILTGMMNGPRGQRQPSSGGGGGMSPIMIALLGLLAYKAFKGRGGQTASSGGVGQTGRLPPGGTTSAGGSGGDLGDILGGLFGGKPGSMPSGSGAKPGGRPGGSLSDLFPGGLGGSAAGSVLTGGLGNIIKELQDNGHGRAAQSWIGTGPNEEIAPKDLANALGSDTLNTLSKQTGLSVDDLLAGLSQHLPDLVDQLTPNGRLPTHEEAGRMI